MDSTTISIANWLFNKINPYKVIKMFARWILRKELKAKDDEIQQLKEDVKQAEHSLKLEKMEIQEAIANLNNKHYCQPCRKHMLKKDGYAECPSCGRQNKPPIKRKRIFSTGIESNEY